MTERSDDQSRNASPASGTEGQIDQAGQPAMQISRPMAEMITALWRAQRRLDQGGDEGRTLIMVQRHVDTAMSRLQEMGVELRSFDGQAYDPGMRSVTPTHFVADPSVERETIGETSSPAILLHGQVAAKAQAAVLVPPVKTSSDAPPDTKEAPKPKATKTPARRKAAKVPPKAAKDQK